MKNADHEICVDTVDSMKRNQINNIGECVCGVGQIPLIAIGIGILYGLHSNASTANNNWALCVLVAWTSVYWLLRDSLVCSGKKKTWTAVAARQEFLDCWTMASLQSRHTNLETQTDSYVSYWYASKINQSL